MVLHSPYIPAGDRREAISFSVCGSASKRSVDSFKNQINKMDAIVDISILH